MKKRILMALAAVLVFGLAAVVFAYNNHSQNHSAAAAHCPMHKQNGAMQAEHKDSCCGMADCCKDGKCSMGGACCKKDKDSCPMKQKDAQTTSSVDMTNVVVVGDGENCCQPGADCCKGGACCNKNKKS
jgi:hypothetical protein